MAILWALVACLPRSRGDYSPTGLPDCRCTEWAGLDQYRVGSVIRYTPPGQSTGYDYPLNYGNSECKAHDQGLEPFCGGAAPPAWCSQKWCYVDKDACSSVVPYRSALFQGSGAYYSYQTCGASNEFEAFAASLTQATPTKVTALLDVVQAYLWSTREAVEQAAVDPSSSCSATEQCPCLECEQNSLWNRKVDFSTAGVSAKENSFRCLARPVTQSYLNIAAKEAKPMERVGYIYFADHARGSYLGWPAVDWCPASSYDPRLRPWYSSGSTGPKDLVIVVDVSGSMQTAGRSSLAKAATKAVIDTLEWKDFATVILFNSGISARYTTTLVAMTDAERETAKSWLDQQLWEYGGTNFQSALEYAFGVIESSVSAGRTSMCQKAILFLTDGEADFGETDFARTKQRAEASSVAIFSYALGSGADTTITKRLACENQGIFYRLDDGVDLASVMSRYYEYFASGVEICTPSFTRYQDAVTGKELWPACLPSYELRDGERGLLGVSCFDLNVMMDPATMKSQSYWDDFVCKLSDLTKKCVQLDLNDCRLEKLRRAVGAESNCIDMAVGTSCPCADPACQDNEDWLDEKGYFCDTWVGDDCYKASSGWGYTSAGQAAVLQQCKRSCSACPSMSSCPEAGQCRTLSSISSTGCRHERTDKVTDTSLEDREAEGSFTSSPARCSWSALLFLYVGSLS